MKHTKRRGVASAKSALLLYATLIPAIPLCAADIYVDGENGNDKKSGKSWNEAP